jgi:hypothetical protein
MRKEIVVYLLWVFCCLILIHGAVNYENSLACVENSDSITDGEIEQISKDYGYDLGWDESPALYQYFISGLTKWNCKCKTK